MDRLWHWPDIRPPGTSIGSVLPYLKNSDPALGSGHEIDKGGEGDPEQDHVDRHGVHQIQDRYCTNTAHWSLRVNSNCPNALSTEINWILMQYYSKLLKWNKWWLLNLSYSLACTFMISTLIYHLTFQMVFYQNKVKS